MFREKEDIKKKKEEEEIVFSFHCGNFSSEAQKQMECVCYKRELRKNVHTFMEFVSCPKGEKLMSQK